VDPLTLELIAQLVRNGTLDADDVDAIAARLETAGEPGAAHQCRAAWAEALAPESRPRLHIITSDGGKGDP
jgi:hypothetical protein